MNKDTIGGIIGTSLSAIGTSIQVDEIMKYVSLAITIIGGLITLISQIVIWWNKAKADGKITKDEINEGIEIVSHISNDIKDEIDKRKEDTK